MPICFIVSSLYNFNYKSKYFKNGAIENMGYDKVIGFCIRCAFKH